MESQRKEQTGMLMAKFSIFSSSFAVQEATDQFFLLVCSKSFVICCLCLYFSAGSSYD